MTTLVLPPRFSDDSNALWRAAIALGWNIQRLPGWSAPETLRGQNVAIYGESLWAHHIAEQLGVELCEPPLDVLATLPFEFTLREIAFSTLAQARKASFPRFVKPAGDKAFEARVYNSPDDLPELNFWPEPLPVLTSEVVAWEVEVRCFVLNRRVQTLSTYWRGDDSTLIEGVYHAQPGELDEAREFAEAVLSSTHWTRGATLDVGRIVGRGWAVIEANPAFGAGIYGCEPQSVLEVVASCARFAS